MGGGFQPRLAGPRLGGAVAAIALQDLPRLAKRRAGLVGVDSDEIAALADAVLEVSRVFLVDAMVGEQPGDTSGGKAGSGADRGAGGDS